MQNKVCSHRTFPEITVSSQKSKIIIKCKTRIKYWGKILGQKILFIWKIWRGNKTRQIVMVQCNSWSSCTVHSKEDWKQEKSDFRWILWIRRWFYSTGSFLQKSNFQWSRQGENIKSQTKFSNLQSIKYHSLNIKFFWPQFWTKRDWCHIHVTSLGRNLILWKTINKSSITLASSQLNNKQGIFSLLKFSSVTSSQC